MALTALLLGLAESALPWQHYFGSLETWRYFTTAVFINQHNLPGVFTENFYPRVVNGSLWTLPVEFLCYVSVAMMGSLRRVPRGLLIAANLLAVVLLASLGPMLTEVRFSSHFEMIAVFWWGVLYGYCTQASGREARDDRLVWLLALLAFLSFALMVERSFERAAMLACAASLTDPLGDLSYGMYIFAFPVQQMLVYWGIGLDWSWGAHFGLSLLGTSLLAYASWHLVERRALRYKPKAVAQQKAQAV